MHARKIFTAFQKAGALFCGLLLIAFTGLVLYSVVMRYFFTPPIWGEELPKLLFVWMIFIGAGFAYLSGQNIRMTFLIDRVAKGPRRMIELVMYGLSIAILLMIFWYSVPILELTSGSVSLSTGLSDGWKFIALPVGALLLLVNAVWRFIRILKGGVDDSVDLSSNP
jgi:TRAP-type C4-dicarboxylate transport system permease small subunit